MVKRMGWVGLGALLVTSCLVQAETVTISGNGPVFDTSVDVTYGYQATGSTLWMREYWNNDYQGFGAYDCRPMIRVDLSSVPENATIDSVSLNLKEIYAANSTAAYVDLWKVHPFTDAVSAWKYDGVNAWPDTDSEGYGVTYFDGIDGYYCMDPETWEMRPADKYLATSDIAINADVSDQWLAFIGDNLTSYIQTQSNQAAGSRFAYFEVSFRDESSEWAEFYSNETGDSTLFPYLEVSYTEGTAKVPGDANGDGKVDVSDLGILAANYGTGTTVAADFNADYAKVFGTAADENATEDTTSSACSSLGLSLIAGLAMLGLMLVKLEE